ncbi:MAG: CapA family protein [Burkholderiales bacterium]|nr:CapA family protein [Burkholderiales bacterium]
MVCTILLTGDVNLMNVTDAAVPFAQVAPTLRGADVLFGNLECCLYDGAGEHSATDEGFWAAPAAGKALVRAGFRAVGNANNVNYGTDAIRSSLDELDRLGIAHTGAGRDAAAARAAAIVDAGGRRVGFLQRTSVYWPTNHEAGERTPGVAALRGHTAYQLPLHKTRPGIPPANRPGVPPVIVTWADRDYLERYRADIGELRASADIVVASHHWGLGEEVLEYMTEIAHAAIDAGADVVAGHGPHYCLPVEIYRGKPIFYGLGSFSFHTGHGGRKHGDWVGMLAKVELEGREPKRASFRFVRHNDANETVLCAIANEAETLERLGKLSARFSTRIEVEGDEAVLHRV